MSTFFAASQQCEAGKPRPRHETNTALLRLPASSPSLIRNTHCFNHYSSKARQNVLKDTAHTYPQWASSSSNAGGGGGGDTSSATPASTAALLPAIAGRRASANASGVVTTDITKAVPPEVLASQEAHRQKLAARKKDLTLLEERDADDGARRAKAKRLEQDRQHRVQRIAAGLQDIGTIDFDPEEDAPEKRLRSAVLGTAYHPQTAGGYLTATTSDDATLADHFGIRGPTMVYATDAIYGTRLHATVAEAAAVRALEMSAGGAGVGVGEGGAARSPAAAAVGLSSSTAAGANSHQLRALLQQQQQMLGGGGAEGGLQGLRLTVGEEAAANVQNYLRGKYGPSMLWPSHESERERELAKRRATASAANLANGSGGGAGVLPADSTSAFSSKSAAVTNANTVGGPMSTGATPTTTVLTASGPSIRHGIPRRLLGQSASQLAEALIARELREQERDAERAAEGRHERRQKALREGFEEAEPSDAFVLRMQSVSGYVNSTSAFQQNQQGDADVTGTSHYTAYNAREDY